MAFASEHKILRLIRVWRPEASPQLLVDYFCRGKNEKQPGETRERCAPLSIEPVRPASSAPEPSERTTHQRHFR